MRDLQDFAWGFIVAALLFFVIGVAMAIGRHI